MIHYKGKIAHDSGNIILEQARALLLQPFAEYLVIEGIELFRSKLRICLQIFISLIIP